jgi:hypothetical protein
VPPTSHSDRLIAQVYSIFGPARVVTFSTFHLPHLLNMLPAVIPRSAGFVLFRIPRRIPIWVCLGLVTTSCSATSCQSNAGGAWQSNATMATQAPSSSLNEYVKISQTLEFRDSAASSEIQVFFDRRAGFIVADEGQTQLRAYTNDATPLWSAGRRGPGPGEFVRLRAAVRTSTRDVVAADNAGSLVFFDSAGHYLREKPTGLGPIYNLLVLSDSTLLIGGRRAGSRSSPLLLHIWNLRRDTLVRSFFPVPAHDPRFDEAYRFSGWATAAVLQDNSLGVVFPLADTLYRYRTDGTPINKIRLPLQHYRRLRDPAPANQSPQALVEWRNSYTRLSDIFVAPDGSVYIQYFNLKLLEPVWGLARFQLPGRSLHKSFEFSDTPRLLGVSPRDSSLYFLQPDDLESVTWSVGRYSH